MWWKIRYKVKTLLNIFTTLLNDHPVLQGPCSYFPHLYINWRLSQVSFIVCSLVHYEHDLLLTRGILSSRKKFIKTIFSPRVFPL